MSNPHKRRLSIFCAKFTYTLHSASGPDLSDAIDTLLPIPIESLDPYGNACSKRAYSQQLEDTGQKAQTQLGPTESRQNARRLSLPLLSFCIFSDCLLEAVLIVQDSDPVVDLICTREMWGIVQVVLALRDCWALEQLDGGIRFVHVRYFGVVGTDVDEVPVVCDEVYHTRVVERGNTVETSGREGFKHVVLLRVEDFLVVLQIGVVDQLDAARSGRGEQFLQIVPGYDRVQHDDISDQQSTVAGDKNAFGAFEGGKRDAAAIRFETLRFVLIDHGSHELPEGGPD